MLITVHILIAHLLWAHLEGRQWDTAATKRTGPISILRSGGRGQSKKHTINDLMTDSMSALRSSMRGFRDRYQRAVMVWRLGKQTLKSEEELASEKEEVTFQAERTSWAQARWP